MTTTAPLSCSSTTRTSTACGRSSPTFRPAGASFSARPPVRSASTTSRRTGPTSGRRACKSRSNNADAPGCDGVRNPGPPHTRRRNRRTLAMPFAVVASPYRDPPETQIPVTAGTLTPTTPCKTRNRVGPRSRDPARSMRIEGGFVKTVKSIATGIAAVAVVGGAAAVAASIAVPGGLGQVELTAVGAPYGPALPQDPPPPPPPPPPGVPGQLPSPDQLAGLCNQATDPDLRKAYRNGNFPEQFNVPNIAPAGPNMAQADVAISGPKFAGPVDKHLVFVNQGGNWVLQHDAAIALIQAATATN